MLKLSKHVDYNSNKLQRHMLFVTNTKVTKIWTKTQAGFSHHRRPIQTLQSYVICTWFPKFAFDWIYHQNCFLFWKIVSKIHNKDDKTNVFCLLCVNCVISFYLDGFWEGFFVHFSCGLALLHKKWQATSTAVTHRKWPKSPISTHLIANIFTE